MGHTVKFRLRSDEMTMLEKVAGERALSETLRELIHAEYRRQQRKGSR